jgi:hypothetical protein
MQPQSFFAVAMGNAGWRERCNSSSTSKTERMEGRAQAGRNREKGERQVLQGICETPASEDLVLVLPLSQCFGCHRCTCTITVYDPDARQVIEASEASHGQL